MQRQSHPGPFKKRNLKDQCKHFTSSIVRRVTSKSFSSLNKHISNYKYMYIINLIEGNVSSTSSSPSPPVIEIDDSPLSGRDQILNGFHHRHTRLATLESQYEPKPEQSFVPTETPKSAR